MVVATEAFNSISVCIPQSSYVFVVITDSMSVGFVLRYKLRPVI